MTTAKMWFLNGQLAVAIGLAIWTVHNPDKPLAWLGVAMSVWGWGANVAVEVWKAGRRS